MEYFQLALTVKDLHKYKVVPYGMVLDFLEMILVLRGCKECISRKNDH